MARLQAKLGRALRYLGLFTLVLLLGGLAVVASGVVSLDARAGHVFFMRDLLPFARSRSVDVHAGDSPDPREALASRAMIERGAAHYEAACATCHGSPGAPPNAFAEGLLPRPPLLASSDLVEERSRKELHWVVYHGLKFAGMPAWPADERVDEVWAVVAFLEALPDMSPAAYRDAAGLDRQATVAAVREVSAGEVPPEALAQCSRCHGVDGLGDRSGAFPNLSLLDARYLRRSLHAYADGGRHSGIMHTQVKPLTEDELDALAAWYGRRPDRAAGVTRVGDETLARGRRIAEEGVPERDLAECGSCHGIGARTDTGVDDRMLDYPQLSGQYAPYLRQQLHAWVDASRGGVRQEDPVVRAAHQLTEDEIRAVAAWYASRDGARHAAR